MILFAKTIITADTFEYDIKEKIFTAKGHVIVESKNDKLSCDALTYDSAKHDIEAKGSVRVTDQKGNVFTSGKAVIKDDFKDALIENLQVITSNESFFTCKRGTRKHGSEHIFEKGLFSSCNIKDPLWTMSAQKITYDSIKKRVHYKHAVLKIKGMPIFWAPYVSHPDASVKRAKGLLFPQLQNSKDFGIIAGFPLYYPFDRFQDATITPYITEKNGAVIKGEFRKNITNGTFHVDGSVTTKKENWHIFMEFEKNLTEDSDIAIHLKRANNTDYLNTFFFVHNKGFLYDEPYISKFTYNKALDNGFVKCAGYWFQRIKENSEPKFCAPYFRVSKDFFLERMGSVSLDQKLSVWSNKNHDINKFSSVSYAALDKLWVLPSGQLLDVTVSSKMFFDSEPSRMIVAPASRIKWSWPLRHNKGILEPVIDLNLARRLDEPNMLLAPSTDYADLFFKGMHDNDRSKITYGAWNHLFLNEHHVSFFIGAQNRRTFDKKEDRSNDRFVFQFVHKYKNFYWQNQSIFRPVLQADMIENGVGYTFHKGSIYAGLIANNKGSADKRCIQAHINVTRRITDKWRIEGGYIGQILKQESELSNLSYYGSAQYENECFFMDVGILKNNFKKKDYRFVLSLSFKIDKAKSKAFAPRIPITPLAN